MSHSTRRYFLQQTALAGGLLALSPRSFAQSANEQVNIGIIGVGGRGQSLLREFKKLPGVHIAAICDPDSEQVDKAAKAAPDARKYADLREVLDSSDIDAVVIASCNHWHCLTAIWAMQAGKHVYVEKPLCNAHWEGVQTARAAAKYGKACQVGTQQRSAPMQDEIKELLHGEKVLGNVEWVRANRFGLRASIGKRDKPLNPPATVDYDLWLGPADDQPIYRNNLQYDWHWDWNTGAGEMGNWGVHIIDDVRNNIFRDEVAFPKRVAAAGGRFAWHDAGNTPNVHFAILDTGSIPVVIALTNIAASEDNKQPPRCPGPGSGYIAYCEGGRLEGQRGNAKLFDTDGKLIKEIKGTDGMGVHQQNFIDAIRNNAPDSLNTPIEMGHQSTAWCNFANYAYRVAQNANGATNGAPPDQGIEKQSAEILDELRKLVAIHEGAETADAMHTGPTLTFDEQAQEFVGDFAARANQFLRRPGRKQFVVPEV